MKWAWQCLAACLYTATTAPETTPLAATTLPACLKPPRTTTLTSSCQKSPNPLPCPSPPHPPACHTPDPLTLPNSQPLAHSLSTPPDHPYPPHYPAGSPHLALPIVAGNKHGHGEAFGQYPRSFLLGCLQLLLKLCIFGPVLVALLTPCCHRGAVANHQLEKTVH